MNRIRCPLALVCGLLLSVVDSSEASITRQDVVDRAQSYADVDVVLSSSNLVNPTGTPLCDSRRNINLGFPLCAGTTLEGEAYKWFGDATTTTYVSNIAAGKKIIIPNSSANNVNFTGIDCSGLIYRAWNLSGNKPNTSDLEQITLGIDWARMRKGDIFLNWDTTTLDHAILLKESLSSTSTYVNIIHATSKHFGPTWQQDAYRVVNDERVEIRTNTAGQKRLEGLIPPIYPRTPFPIFEGWTPANGTISPSSNPVITATIRSKSSITAGSIRLSVDGVERGTISGSGSTVNVSTVVPMVQGAHTISLAAENSRNFLDSDSIGVVVDTSAPVCILQDKARFTLESTTSVNSAILGYCVDFLSGIAELKLEDPSGVIRSTATFLNSPTSAFLGPYAALSTGTYAFIATDGVGNIGRSTFSVLSSSGQARICMEDTDGAHCSQVALSTMVVQSGTMTITIRDDFMCDNGPAVNCETRCLKMVVSCSTTGCYRKSTTTTPTYIESRCDFDSIRARSFTISDTTTTFLEMSPIARADFFSSTGGLVAQTTAAATDCCFWSVIYGTVTVPQTMSTSSVLSADHIVDLKSYVDGVSITTPVLDAAMVAGILDELFARFGSPYQVAGSEFVFSTGTTISFSTSIPIGTIVDTTTLHIYRYDSISWSSASVSNQYIYLSTVTSILIATGTVTQSGYFALLFQGHDSSAPTTTFSIQGSSFAFDGTVFISTNAYAILAATDPVVNGFASQVATTYFRIDAVNENNSFDAYVSSFPLLPGFHVLDYYSVDYAGNIEPVKTSTFLVTAATLFKASGRLISTGTALVGYSNLGALLGLNSRAENDYTVKITSADGSAFLSVQNFGYVGLKVLNPVSRLDVDGGLSLRSGNSIASTSSVQIAFGYNGETSFRHALVTRHSTDTVGNSLDFYVWNLLAASSSSIAAMDLLALQASTNASGGVFHVRPAGNPGFGVELIVSNGATLGGGRVLRASAGSHSEARLKTDVVRLGEKDESAAYNDVLALRQAAYLYKSELSGLKPHRGPIFEEAPDSIRGPGGTISLDARLANIEMSIKEAARRLQRLRSRLDKLEKP